MAKSSLGQGTLEPNQRVVHLGAALEQLFRDVRFGLRLLRREPGFAATTVLTLTLAIGATTTIFSVVNAVLLQPPPFPEPDRLVTLWQTDPNNANRSVEPAPANFLDWREQATSFEQVAAVEPFSFDFTGDGAPEVFYASLVTEGFFEVLRAGAALGRTFLPEEFQPGSGVVMLTHGFWERRFGGDAGILGRSLTLDQRPYTVVGVLPADFELALEGGRGERDIYVPKAVAEYETYIRANGWWHVVARVRPEATLAGARAEMDAVAARLAADYPRTNTGVGARVIPLHTRQVAAVRPALLLLWGGAALVLLIACVNVANLMLARCTRRAQEFTIRTAVGGGRGRLLRQLLTESAVIATLGGIGGVALTVHGLDAIVALMPADVPRVAEVTVNGRILGFAVGLVLATAMAFGLAPALQMFRRDVAGLLRAQRTGTTPAQQRLRRSLVAAEVALALVLLVGAGLLLQSSAALHDDPAGAVRRGGPDARRPRHLRGDRGRHGAADAGDRPAPGHGRPAAGRGADGRPRRDRARRLRRRARRSGGAVDLAVSDEPAVRNRADRRHYTGRGLRPAAARGRICCLAAGAARRPRRSARCTSYRIGSRD